MRSRSTIRRPLTLLALGLLAGCSGSDDDASAGANAVTSTGAKARMIYVALDAFHPKYLTLDAKGNPGGHAGNWLTPNLRQFFSARDHLPSATDMNHLNALAGTSSGQTGVVGVGQQIWGWGVDGKPIAKPIKVTDFRDPEGRPIDTVFHAWKRKWPAARTAFISGKDWVAEGYRGTGAVDQIVTSSSRPSYVAAPTSESFFDPPGDEDGRCDPESARQKELALLMQAVPTKAPPDSWTVSAALGVYANEPPDLAYILLAQTDDEGHALGAAHDPLEFTPGGSYDAPPLCTPDFSYNVVSKRYDAVYREPVLDSIRQVDREFGRLIKGLAALKVLDNATVVVLSDHSMVTHLRSMQFDPKGTDYAGMLKDAGLATDTTLVPYSATSFALLYFHPSIKQNLAAAKQLLLGKKAWNVQTGRFESPWWVLDRAEMKNGLPGVVAPGELYHEYFVEADAEKTMVWPDLVLLAKAGFQVPAYSGMIANLGISIPADNLVFTPFVGGHGSLDTQPILMAFRVPGKLPKTLSHDVKIADIDATVRSLFKLDSLSSTVGRDLSSEL